MGFDSNINCLHNPCLEIQSRLQSVLAITVYFIITLIACVTGLPDYIGIYISKREAKLHFFLKKIMSYFDKQILYLKRTAVLTVNTVIAITGWSWLDFQTWFLEKWSVQWWDIPRGLDLPILYHFPYSTDFLRIFP